MVASALNVAAEQVVEYSAFGVLLERDGNHSPSAAPQNTYATSDRDDNLEQNAWVLISVADDEQWRFLRRAIGDPSWAADEALSTAAGRYRHRDLIDAELSAWCAVRQRSEIVASLWQAGVPVAPVVHPVEQLGFEQLWSRRFFEFVDHPVVGRSTHVTFPFRLPGQDGPMHRQSAPTLGQHNVEILGEILGLPAERVEELQARGVIGAVPRL